MVAARRLALVLAGVLLASGPATAEVRACWPGAVGTRVLWAVADVDGDRVVDLVRVSTASASSRPEVIAGACALTTASPRTAAGGRLTARDVDADRDLDLVQVDATGTPVRTWLNDGAGHFEPVASDAAGVAPRSSSMALVTGGPLRAIAGSLPSRDRLARPAPTAVATRPTDCSDALGTAAASLPTAPVRPGGGPRAPPRDTSCSRSVTS